MVKNYTSLNSNTTLGFNKKSTRKSASGNAFKIMRTSWSFMILMLLSMTIVQDATANNTITLVFTTSYTHHPVILKSSAAQGYGGGYGYAFFSPTDHDIPICYRDGITTKTTNKLLQYNNTLINTNIKNINTNFKKILS